MTTAQQFEIGTRVRLVCDPAWCGEVIAHEADGGLCVTFTIGEQIATGRHSPDALDAKLAIGPNKFTNHKRKENTR